MFLWQHALDNCIQCTLAQKQKLKQTQNSGGHPWQDFYINVSIKALAIRHMSLMLRYDVM